MLLLLLLLLLLLMLLLPLLLLLLGGLRSRRGSLAETLDCALPFPTRCSQRRGKRARRLRVPGSRGNSGANWGGLHRLCARRWGGNLGTGGLP